MFSVGFGVFRRLHGFLPLPAFTGSCWLGRWVYFRGADRAPPPSLERSWGVFAEPPESAVPLLAGSLDCAVDHAPPLLRYGRKEKIMKDRNRYETYLLFVVVGSFAF